MAATLDGRVAATGAVFEAKFMLPWSFSEEAAVAKYVPQLQHNMWVVAARSAVLSVITGGGKWVEIATHADPLYQHLIVTAERKFWRCVESGEPPALFGVEPPKPRIEAVRIVDMSTSNAWAEFAGAFTRTHPAFLEHERDVGNLNSAEGAAVWARRTLPAKNSLQAADARQVEEAFEAKLTAINGPSNSASVGDRHDVPQAQPTNGDGGPERSTATGHAQEIIDKSELAHPEPRRIRDKDHLRFVSTQPCLICGRTPADPHHLRFAQSRALGRKVSDEWVVALCRGHHRELHRHGDERDWWEKAGIDPNVAARSLWLQSHPSHLERKFATL